MSKEEYATELVKMGFNAVLEDGVIIITIETEKDAKRANKAVREIGYNSSFGIRKR